MQLSPLTQARIRRFFHNRSAIVALSVLVALFIIGLLAPILAPASPHEITPLADLEPYVSVDLTLRPRSQTGRFDLLADGTVTNILGAHDILQNGQPLTNQLCITPTIATAISNRFMGKKCTRLLLPVTATDGRQRNLRFLPTENLSPPPSKLRIGVLPFERTPPVVTYSFPDPKGTSWTSLTSDEQAQLKSFADQPISTNICWKGLSTDLIVTRASVSWPFRPVPNHPFGIDSAGRDVLSRIIYGLRISLIFGLALALWSALFGIIVGALQGFCGGWVDVTCQRMTEIWHALPFLYVMILVGSVIGRSFLLLLLCYGAFNWIGVSYYMRAEFLRLRAQPFVEAAMTQHLSRARIIFRHILPNALTPIITLFPFNLVSAIASLVALDFLGFGLPPLTPSLGELLQQAQQFRWAWWLIFYPSLAIFLLMFATIMVGEGIRDAFDPKPQNHME